MYTDGVHASSYNTFSVKAHIIICSPIFFPGSKHFTVQSINAVDLVQLKVIPFL